MTTEAPESLSHLLASQLFAIEAAEGLGPFGPDIDRVCYHLHADFDDPTSHFNSGEVIEALRIRGIDIEPEALGDYPYEIWEKRWPTRDWVETAVPNIFAVLNEFEHGLYDITYEPVGAAGDLYSAALRYGWTAAADFEKHPDWEPEDLSDKFGGVVLSMRIADEVYMSVRAGQLSSMEAVTRIDMIQPALLMRAPATITMPVLGKAIPKYDGAWEKLKCWAVDKILSGSVQATLN